MSGAFDIAWSVLKADPNQQLLQPQHAMVNTFNPQQPLSRTANWPTAVGEMQYQPAGAMHSAITGMMQRQGIQQPAQGSYAGPSGAALARQGPAQQNPVQRQPVEDPSGTVRPGTTYYNRGTPERSGQRLDADMFEEFTSAPTHTGEQHPQGSVGITPYQNVMQEM